MSFLRKCIATGPATILLTLAALITSEERIKRTAEKLAEAAEQLDANTRILRWGLK